MTKAETLPFSVKQADEKADPFQGNKYRTIGDFTETAAQITASQSLQESSQ